MLQAPLRLAESSRNEEEDESGGLDHFGESPKQQKEALCGDSKLAALKHISVLKQHLDTFVAYKWLLQALLRRAPGAAGGCLLQVSDVVLFTDAEPVTWIFTNRIGCLDSKRFVANGATSMWPRFLKTARRGAGITKDDL